MTTDYDAPRTRADVATDVDTGVRLDTRRADAAAATLNVDDDVAGGYPSVGYPHDLFAGDELHVAVVAQRRDEFTCGHCFLVHHRSRYSRTQLGKPMCRDCA